MTSEKKIRLSKLAKEFNVGVGTLVDFLHKKGYDVSNDPNAKVDGNVVSILEDEFGSELDLKKKTEQQKENLKALRDKKKSISIDDIESEEEEPTEESTDDEVIIKTTTIEAAKPIEIEKPKIDLKVKGKIDLDKGAKKKQKSEPEPKEEPTANKKEEDTSITKEEKRPEPEEIKTEVKVEQPKVVGKIDIDSSKKSKKDKKEEKEKSKEKQNKVEKQEDKEPKQEQEEKKEKPVEPTAEASSEDKQEEVYKAKVEKLTGPTIKGKIDLSQFETKKKPVASSSDFDKDAKKKKRKRIKKGEKATPDKPGTPANTSDPKRKEDNKAKKLKKKKKKVIRPEVDEEEVQRQIKETLARLTSKGKTKSSKYRREKREVLSARQREELERQEQEKKILKVTEFVSANELSAMMNVPVTDVIDVCMNLGLMVSINQRLDAETMALVADEFGYQVEFISADLQEDIKEEEEDRPEDLVPRPPIVTVMGHVDHGKTSLLDYIRHSNVIAGEAGGITQHIGAYSVEVEDGKRITFLDTPGHEAFTAMRARGAKLTDVAIIVVAADDAVMPQTVEAINHASAAGVPIVFAINKIDKPTADPEKIKGELANMNYLVEDWGGKYQCQEISAKQGLNVDKLLEKVLLEAELQELKANPKRKATGTVIESSLDKGRGYVATVLVQNGTLHQGDIMLAGIYYGHVKAMFNERGQRIQEAGPSTPVQVIGLNGAPQAGDYFNILDSDKEAREIANKREQLVRMQS
ncbi:MAG: translation initiation factor, partial [Tenuifilum sp.]|uniref:translation initiation factor IF-2 n=1 Tax=Tenuifilum sp. TaxID=2760880 RepID=UPI0024AA72D6